jgi:replicative DNA helicase
MSAIQLVNRLIISETEIPGDKIKNGKLSPEEWSLLESRIKSLTEAQIFIDDTPAISVFELRAKCRRLKAQGKLDVVVVDYLQLMTGPPDAGSREQEVSSISRSLKSIAKELAVPVLALSQLNRSVETRGGNKKPMLSDLRESGAIEQDADMVVFIHRPEKMGVMQFEDGGQPRVMPISYWPRTVTVPPMRFCFISRRTGRPLLSLMSSGLTVPSPMYLGRCLHYGFEDEQ